MRKERAELIQQEINRKFNEKIDGLKMRIEECKLLQNKFREITGSDDVTSMTHEQFSKCNGDELKTFIMSRKSDLPKSKLPKKGKVADAILGERNLISIAYSCRALPNILFQQLKEAEDEREQMGLDDNQIAFKRHEVVVNQSLTHSIKSSSLLDNDEGVSRVKASFCKGNREMNTVSDDLKRKADDLQMILLTRLRCHINRRIDDPKVRDHWCLGWAAKNVAP